MYGSSQSEQVPVRGLYFLWSVQTGMQVCRYEGYDGGLAVSGAIDISGSTSEIHTLVSVHNSVPLGHTHFPFGLVILPLGQSGMHVCKER